MPFHCQPSISHSPLPSGIIKRTSSPLPLSSSLTLTRTPALNPTREVKCFECGGYSSIPKNAISAQCSHCLAYIKVDTITLGPRSHRTTTRTRGDVIVDKQAILHNYHIECENLIIYGQLSGDIQCERRCIVKHDQLFSGKLTCRNLSVAKHTKMVCAGSIRTFSCHVYGTFEGDITVDGVIHIHKSARVIGNITSNDIRIDTGDSHFGKTIPISKSQP